VGPRYREGTLGRAAGIHNPSFDVFFYIVRYIFAALEGVAGARNRTGVPELRMATEVLWTGDIVHGLMRLARSARAAGRLPRIVLHCRDASEAIPVLRTAARPDFLLLDPEVPWRAEVDLLETIRKERMPTKVAILVPRLDSPQAIEIAKLGPAALISRELDPRLLIEALERAFPATGIASENEVKAPRAIPTDEQASQAWLHDIPLTRREIEVTQLLAGRLRDREIAARLCISEGTEGTPASHLREAEGPRPR